MRIPPLVRRAVAGAKPLIPERAWPTLLGLRSLLNDGPIIGLPPLAHPLVVAPHPDDETIGCGGTLALLGRSGVATSVLFATDGEGTIGASSSAPVVAAAREREARVACERLGVGTATFVHLPDGGLGGDGAAELRSAVEGAVARSGADGVFVPWFGDGHPDHGAVSAAICVSSLPDELEVWAYETWTPVPCNRLVDITAAVDDKRAALAAHATAALAFDLEATLGLNRYRSIHGLMGRGYAEGFLALPLGRYRRLRDRAFAAGRDLAR